MYYIMKKITIPLEFNLAPRELVGGILNRVVATSSSKVCTPDKIGLYVLDSTFKYVI